MATLAAHGQTAAAPAAKAGVTKRLRAELMKLMMAGDKNATAFPCGDNLLYVNTFFGGWSQRRSYLSFFSAARNRLPALPALCLHSVTMILLH